jgi:hypothetical protein
MLHASASRAAHRAAPGGLALLVRPTAGQHRHPPTRPRLRLPVPEQAWKDPQRTMHLVMTGIGALIMLGICGLSSFFVIVDERRGLGAADTGTVAAGEAVPYTISSRRIDPQPLTLAEVFSAAQIRLEPGSKRYRVAMSHIDSDCEVATTGTLGPLLEKAGCTQVVRAAMTAPYGDHQVTAGIFNLTDAAAAQRAGEQVRAMVEAGQGSFAAMAAGAAPGQDPLDRPDAQVAWHDHGHFLVYCVISRPDGAVVAADDPDARRITADLLDTYLSGEIIGARERRP